MATETRRQESNMKRSFGWAALTAYIGTVFAANYFITHVGTQPFPGGPHTIPVGFGYQAPSGVLFVGLAFTFRDFVQSLLKSRLVVCGAIVAGALLSYLVAPSLAFASGAAFLISEGLDFAVYTPLIDRGRVVAGIALGSAAEYDVSRPAKCLQRLAQVLPAISEDGMPKVKLHGLRMLNPAITSRVPLSSADSCNVARNIGIDSAWTGSYAPATKETRADVLVERIESTSTPHRLIVEPLPARLFEEVA